MKIGILTFHRSINNGAVMQCYALSKRLQQEFPQDIVEVIDYHMPKIEKNYTPSLKQYLSGGFNTKVKRLVRFLLNPTMFQWQKKRKIAFEIVINTLPLSKETIFDNGVEQLFSFINKNYDVVIAGSDAIWNYVTRGFPNPYFLDSSISCPKLSYAASCYGMSYEKIPKEQKKQIKEILDTYHFLGVRDDESKKFVTFMECIAPIEHTCDPTVFLDINNLPVDPDIIVEKLTKKGFDFSKPTIGVMGSNKMCNMVRKLYGHKVQIASLYEYNKKADVNLYDLSPFEWAYVFRFFKVTITTYFHGTHLSLRNGVPVVCVALETEYSKTHKTKVQDFLERIGLEDSYFHSDYQNTSIDEIKTKLDYYLKTDVCNEIIQKMDLEAQTFLPFLNALKEIKKQYDAEETKK